MGYTKEQLESMLNDVIIELDLSDDLYAEHMGGASPAELVSKKLADKDREIRMLKKRLELLGGTQDKYTLLEKSLISEIKWKIKLLRFHKCDSAEDVGNVFSNIDQDAKIEWKFIKREMGEIK